MLIGEKITGSVSDFWNDELENAKILLVEVEKAIKALTSDMVSSGGVQSYTLNTGQDSQTVTRADISQLYAKREALLKSIDDLERKLGLHGGARIIVPAY